MLSKEEVLLITYFTAVLVILLLFVVIFFIAFQNRKNKILLQQHLAQQKYDQELAKSQIEIQENTLKNIAWELHDNVGQLLSVANLQLNILGGKVPVELEEELNGTKSIITDTVQEIRSLSKVLNNDVVLKNGLIVSIEVEVNRLNRLGYLEASFEILGDPIPINNASSIIIFRIIQEALSNIIRHARATKLFILLDYREKFLEITITDNGVGFDMKEQYLGSGMETMRTRAGLINSNLMVRSEPGKGTQLFLKYIYNDGRRKEKV